MNQNHPLLAVEQVCKSFGDRQVSSNIEFSLKKGEIGCLLGPSGCGKTTLLRVIAGFESIQSGAVRIDGRIVSSNSVSEPPERRAIGMVFQDYALFPHLSVFDNVGFGLGRLARAERHSRINELLAIVGLDEVANNYPHEISGGQQQRVALARALAPRPELLLLDEPFSNLDALLRERLTVEVRDIIKELGTTALLVTHNQHEAFSVADKIGLLFDGTMQQWDDVHSIYHKPASLEVAHFVGEGTLIHGVITAPDKIQTALGLLEGNFSTPCEAGCQVNVLIRPEDILHVEETALQATVLKKSFRGANIVYLLQLPSGEKCQALVSSHHNHRIGEKIGISPEVDNLIVFAQDCRS